MKVLLVGASSSVGRATLAAFEREGHRVLPTYCHTPIDHPFATHLDLRLQGCDALVKALDVFEAVDVVVILSGVIRGRLLSWATPAEINHDVDVNLVGPVRLLQLLRARRYLTENALVMLMASISGERGSYDAIYASTKAAVLMLAKTLAREWAPDVRVNALAPGLIRGSTMYKTMASNVIERHEERYGSLLELEDVANIILDLTRPHWRHLNGAVVHMDGGPRG